MRKEGEPEEQRRHASHGADGHKLGSKLSIYILSLMSVNSPADSVLRTAFCHYPENYITLMEYYDPAEHGMEAYTRK